MTQIAVQAQIEALDKAAQKALQSKESAQKFLMDAGILTSPKKATKPKSNKQTK